ncbi:MAG: S8 family serine peptidase [Planctomycetes bacterium]|nr:S8 family serine peptidase [Planctomycetota bacterium]
MQLSRCLPLVVCALLGLAHAQTRRPQVVDREAAWRDASIFETSVLELKLCEGVSARVHEGTLVSEDDPRVAELSSWLAGARVDRLFWRSEKELAREYQALLAETGGTFLGQVIPDLNLWFRVTLPSGWPAADVAVALRELAIVECATPAIRLERIQPPTGGDIFPPTPDFESMQDYREAAPTGVNERFARVIPGGRGEAVQVTDMEGDWHFVHEDLCKLQGALIGPQPNIASWRNHGTAVSGEIVGDRNGYGVTGIADGTNYRVSSFDVPGVPAAIDNAAAASTAGDAILLEIQYDLGGGDYVPAEHYQANYDAILRATARGIHVIEAAGNGGNDLDATRFSRRYDLTFRDSGAIMVGATEGASLNRAGFSNYGTRITCNGWGRNVVTTGYGGLFDPTGLTDQHYTATFSGTSSASPIVTGVVADLSSLIETQEERVLTNGEMRQLLRQYGTPQANPQSGIIGNRPDLQQMLAALGYPDGLFLADDPELGGSTTFEMEGTAGNTAVLFMAFDAGSTDIGLNRKLLLDLVSLGVLVPLVLDGNGEASLTLPIPADTNLIGAEAFFQVLEVAPVTFAARLTNSVVGYIAG